MEKLVIGVILAGLSAITFLAYKHPKAYANYFYPWKEFLFSLVVIGIWNFSNIKSYEILSPYFVPEKASEADETAKSIRLGWGFIMLFGGSFAYLTLLRLLPFALKEDKPIEKKGEKEGE